MPQRSRQRPHNIEVGLIGDTTYVYAERVPAFKGQPAHKDFLMTWKTDGPSGSDWAIQTAIGSAELLREHLNQGAYNGITVFKFPTVETLGNFTAHS